MNQDTHNTNGEPAAPIDPLDQDLAEVLPAEPLQPADGSEQAAPTQAPDEANPTTPVSEAPLAPELDGTDLPDRITSRGPSEHVTQKWPVTVPLKDPWDDMAPTLHLTSENWKTTESVLESYTAGEEAEVKKSEKWLSTLEQGLENAPMLGVYENMSEREGAKFEHAVPTHNGAQHLAISKPKIGDGDEAILRGEQAKLRMRAYMGLGGLYRVPLWNSGFWVTVKSPGEDAQMELDRKIRQDGNMFGRMTRGLLFTNTSVVIASNLLDFFLDHVVSTTLKDSSRENLMKRITVQDLQHIAWAMACSIWPNGYQYRRAILGKTPAENRVEEGLIAVNKLQWTDTNALTDWQLKHMSRVTIGSMTNEDLDRYQSEFTVRQDRVITLNEKVKLHLSIPSAQAHIHSGMRWVNQLTAVVNEAFGLQADPDIRGKYMLAQARTAILRQHAHWIKAVELGEARVESEEDIEAQLAILSEDPKARVKITQEIIQYSQDTTISFIAIPTVNEEEEEKFPRAPHLLPIDAMATFFTLLEQKLLGIWMREAEFTPA